MLSPGRGDSAGDLHGLGWEDQAQKYRVRLVFLLPNNFSGEPLFSALFFWPRNTIMFTEGTAVHSVAFLQQTAQEFQTWHWFRLALNAVFSILAFVGLLQYFRHSVLSQDEQRKGEKLYGKGA